MISKYGELNSDGFDSLKGIVDWKLKSFKEYTSDYHGDLIPRNIERKCKFPFA